MNDLKFRIITVWQTSEGPTIGAWFELEDDESHKHEDKDVGDQEHGVYHTAALTCQHHFLWGPHVS